MKSQSNPTATRCMFTNRMCKCDSCTSALLIYLVKRYLQFSTHKQLEPIGNPIGDKYNDDDVLEDKTKEK